MKEVEFGPELSHRLCLGSAKKGVFAKELGRLSWGGNRADLSVGAEDQFTSEREQMLRQSQKAALADAVKDRPSAQCSFDAPVIVPMVGTLRT